MDHKVTPGTKTFYTGFTNIALVGALLNVFENIEALEPKCPRCRTKIVLGVTTTYYDKVRAHVCLKCGGKLL